MPASALALAAEAAVRVVSLNLCTDELLLLLAPPAQIASITHLARDPRESVLWRQARRYPGNEGSLESIARLQPTLVLTMGGGGKGVLARRLGLRLLDLPYPRSPAEVIGQARQVAAALGVPNAAEPSARRLSTLRPLALRQGAMLSAGGLSIAPDGLAAGWLRLAGYSQPALPGNRLTLERLATKPPKWLIRSDYRQDQQSRAAAFLRHPLVSRLGPRTVMTDGRPWTCGGLPMLAEVARLRAGRR